MRPYLLVSLLACASCMVSVPCFALDGNEAPQMNALSAKTAKPGDTITITGVSLNESRIDEIYLTDHQFDMKMKVLEQKDTSITVRVPPFAKPGRMQILCLTKGEEPKLLEQPLYLLIKDPSDTTEEAAEPVLEVIQMKAEDLPPPGQPIPIQIQAKPQVTAAPAIQAKSEPAVSIVPAKAEPAAIKKTEAPTEVSQAKKPDPAKTPDQHDKQ